MYKNLLSLLFSVLFFSLFAQNINQQFENVASENNLVGMSVAVSQNNEITHEYFYGQANIQNNKAIDENSIYRIASISKFITATALLKLYEQGLFDLDDDVSDYLGFDFSHPNYTNKSISFRMLLSHTSSIVDGNGYHNFRSVSYRNPNAPEIEELLSQNGSYYTSDIFLNKTPGTYFSYSNLNYGIIATLVEAISDTRFDVYVKERILNPLEIEGSFNTDDLIDINDVATLYRSSQPAADDYNGVYPTEFNGNNYTIGTNGLIFSPQGGFRCTVRDLCKFMAMHYNYGKFNNVQVLDSLTIALMHNAEWTNNGSNGNNYYNLFNSWGLGPHLITNQAQGDFIFPDKNMIGHPGEAYGLISDLYFVKNEKFGLVFITNGYKNNDGYNWGTNSAFYQPEEEVFEIIYNEIYQKPTTDVASSLAYQPEFFYRETDNTLCINNNCIIDSVSIYDIKGNIIVTEKWNGNLKLPNLEKGIYIIVSKKSDVLSSTKMYLGYQF